MLYCCLDFSAAATAGDVSKGVTKFARGARYSMHQQQLQYKEQVQMIFDNQVDVTSTFVDSFRFKRLLIQIHSFLMRIRMMMILQILHKIW
jgi:hypothetical protein